MALDFAHHFVGFGRLMVQLSGAGRVFGYSTDCGSGCEITQINADVSVNELVD